MDNSIKITYESLFELLRNEKNREELQTLDKNLFKNIIEYLEEKKSILDKPDDNIFIKNEKQKTEQQLTNIKRIIKDLIQRREKKIISMALLKSRVDAKIDESSFLYEEKEIFDKLVELFDKTRDSIINNILECRLPDKDFLKTKQEEIIEQQKTEENKQDFQEREQKNENYMIRFIQYVPSFVGTDLNIYGPFEPEDMARVPSRIAQLLVEKKAAEMISIK